MNLYLPSKLHSKLNAAAALRQISMQDLVIEKIDKELTAAVKKMGPKAGQ